MQKISLSRLKNAFSKYLRQAQREPIVVTHRGKAAGILIGFADEDEWFDYRLEHDPRFLNHIAAARRSLRAGKGVRLEELA